MTTERRYPIVEFHDGPWHGAVRHWQWLSAKYYRPFVGYYELYPYQGRWDFIAVWHNGSPL